MEEVNQTQQQQPQQQNTTSKKRRLIPQQQSQQQQQEQSEEDTTATGTATTTQPQLCAFCDRTPAAVLVPLPGLRKRKSIPTAYCLLHYYTTSACRVANNTIINQQELERQLPPVQELFAEAFVQLRDELQETALEQFQRSNDPLSIINDLSRTGTKKAKNRQMSNKAPKPKKKTMTRNVSGGEGGFLRDVPLPQRLVQTQRQQLLHQQQLTARMNRATAASASTSTAKAKPKRKKDDPTQRRQPTRQSVWNVLGNEDRSSNNNNRKMKKKEAPKQQQTSAGVSSVDHETPLVEHDKTCTSCGRQKVQVLSSSLRNQDFAKAETWGTKDRDGGIMTRYQCGHCGKVWNEEE